jgi:hypothetical protein
MDALTDLDRRLRRVVEIPVERMQAAPPGKALATKTSDNAKQYKKREPRNDRNP